MAQSLVPDELWKLVEPLLPSEPPKLKGGRPRVPARQVLTGILVEKIKFYLLSNIGEDADDM
jgi:hypothetical protein